MFKKIAIIGVGLIGGSIGLAVKKQRLAKEVVGVCRHQQSLRLAKAKGAIDYGTLNYKTAVREANLVILASPITQIIKIGKRILPDLKKGCLISDVGSTKASVVRSIEKVLPVGVYFVGAHPLAGSEKRGVASARADLFSGTICILTKTKRTNAAAFKKLASFWQRLGCRIKVLTPQKHDQVMALTSHLPHLAAVQIVRTAKSGLDFAASGFFDTTRIASSDAEIWADIFLTNKKFITQAMDKYIDHLRQMRRLISQEDRAKITAQFQKIKKLRDAQQR